MAVPAVLGCHPLIGWRALQSWASVGLFQLSTKGVERRRNQLGGFKKEDGAERVNATGGASLNDRRRCGAFLFGFFEQSTRRSFCCVSRLIRALSFQVV